ncbi:TPA: hypothetical protein DCE37_01230 [Candidatus Latescibacteria bacterium]|nr:hypothetical protein [Candidatus Latescibacterota bacterium]
MSFSAIRIALQVFSRLRTSTAMFTSGPTASRINCMCLIALSSSSCVINWATCPKGYHLIVSNPSATTAAALSASSSGERAPPNHPFA